MSDTLLAHRTEAPASGRQRTFSWALIAVGILVALVIPLFVSAYWLQLAFTVCSLGVAMVGLTMLTGAGQLSMGAPFFMAVGSLTYVVLAGSPTDSGEVIGFGLPPVAAAIAGTVAGGIAGLIFSPIASRLSGIYLAMASLGLVILAEHILNNMALLSGGFNGRRSPDFELFGIVFGRTSDPLVIFGVPFGRQEWLWYLGIGLLLAAILFARNIKRSRSGRALQLVANSDLTASVAGVHVRAYKARIFFLSSLYGGLGGVLYTLAMGSIAPTSFNIDLALKTLAIIVIGGIGSIGGAVAGTVFVVCLPLVLQPLLGYVPFLANDAATASYISRYVYGLAVILVLLFWPRGLAGIGAALASGFQSRRSARLAHEKEVEDA